MKKRLAWLTFGSIVALALAGTSAIAWFYFGTGQTLESQRFDAEETEFSVSNPSGSRLRLFRAGDAMKDAVPVPGFNGSSLWIRPGNYFLEAGPGQGVRYYPVVLRGYRSGHDRDGSFGVTVLRSGENLSVEDLVRMADEAMYLVKNTTRNNIALAGEGIRA